MAQVTVDGGNTINPGFIKKNYRVGVTAPDVISPVPSMTTWAIPGAGPAAATYRAKIVAGSIYGRTTSTQGSDVITSGGNLTGRIAFAQVSHADYYDIFYSAIADPLWVARITEAQRAAGCVVTEVGVVGAGGVPGSVDIQVAGTGGAVGSAFAQNIAYYLDDIPVFRLSARGRLIIYTELSAQGQTAAPALTTLPFVYRSSLGLWLHQSQAQQIWVYGGANQAYSAWQQGIIATFAPYGLVKVAVASMAGLGASVTIHLASDG